MRFTMTTTLKEGILTVKVENKGLVHWQADFTENQINQMAKGYFDNKVPELVQNSTHCFMLRKSIAAACKNLLHPATR